MLSAREINKICTLGGVYNILREVILRTGGNKRKENRPNVAETGSSEQLYINQEQELSLERWPCLAQGTLESRAFLESNLVDFARRRNFLILWAKFYAAL